MPAFDTGVPALLLRLDPNPFHHGTLGAVRSLGRAGIEVHAVVESPRSPVTRSRHLHRAHAAPLDRGLPSVLRTLRRISDIIGRPAVLVPMDDLGAIAAARLAGQLTGRYLLPAQPPDLPERVADKAELAGICEGLGIPHPDTVVPGSAALAVAAARELGLPAVAKWSRPWLLPGGSGLRSTCLVRTPGEAGELYARTERAGSSLLLQRRLPESPSGDWFFHGYARAAGGCAAGGAGRKERAWPHGAGLTAAGRRLPNPEIERAAARLVGALGYRGVFDLDFRLDPRTGRCHLLDFNPRPGAQFRLFTDSGGLDVVRALHLDLTGRPVTTSAAEPGRVFVVENYLLLSLLAAPPGRRPERPAGIEAAWFAGDDPGPFLAMAAASLGRGAAKALARAHRPRPPAARAPVPPGRRDRDRDDHVARAPVTRPS
ncbi:ATP-grasp domain-containing protein [Streptomyces sp. GC420]|uniref:carboxylate--amine ligase n=1 Tax=Streptomyces sp. GC420 TaxID=2697568 RepID=UPI001AA105E5|nr:ATP-grasp domain-containing protein [Streptomyces sp. GC420]